MAVTRELVITYGSYVVGTTSGSSGPDGKVQLTKGFERGSVEFSFLVTGATAAAFAANCVAAEAAFRKPYQDLTITLSAENLLVLQQSANTALDPQPEIVKRESVGDTGRSRIYTVRIEYGLPADTGAETVVGLREYSIDVAYDPARRRTVTLAGTFTASSSNDARAQYEAQIATLVASAKSDLSVTYWELTDEDARTDTNAKLCEFSHTYEEVIFSQGGSSLEDANLVRQRLSIARRREAPGDTPTAERFVTLDLSYEAWIDSDQTTDLRGEFSRIRSWLVTQITNTLDGGDFAVVEERPEYFYDENRIAVAMVVLGLVGGEDVIEQRVTVEDDDAKGIEVVPAWSGDDLAAYHYPGPRIVVRTITHTLRRIGSWTEQDALSFAAAQVSSARGRPPADASGGQWLLIHQRPAATQLRLGLDTETLDVTEHSIVTQLRYVKEPRVSVPTGGGGAITDPRS